MVMTNIIKEIDINHDGDISADEWIDYMTQCQTLRESGQGTNSLISSIKPKPSSVPDKYDINLRNRINLYNTYKFEDDEIDEIINIAKQYDFKKDHSISDNEALQLNILEKTNDSNANNSIINLDYED